MNSQTVSPGPFKNTSINSNGQISDTLTILKEVLKNSWRFDHEDFLRAKETIDAHCWDVSSLTIAYLDAQTKRLLDPPESTKSLVNIAADRLADELAATENLASDITVIIDALPIGLLREVLKSGRIPYPVLRTILAKEKTGYGPLALLQDIDEAILRGNSYTNKDEKYLVKLEELVAILGGTPKNDILEFQRKRPPSGGFEFLDVRRKHSMKILANDSAIQTTFDRLTEGILKGLDWSNIVVVGGMVLQTLMATDPSHDNDRQVLDSDIDLYVYGLNVEEANAKIEHVYDIWTKNLPDINQSTSAERVCGRQWRKYTGREDNLLANKIIVKNSRTINFMANYPTRRIQIVLKLHESPMHVFKDTDIDVCAMCYNGKQILMTPRCARAIETGYSTFTMNLIWGHQHSYKRPTYEQRIFKYADRGFGLRILPVYMKTLERGPKDSHNSGDQNSTYDLVPELYKRYANLEAYRKPSGAEPGHKTLRRVVELGRDFVRRWIEYDIKHGQIVGPYPDTTFEGRVFVPRAQRYLLHPEHMDSHNNIPYVREARFDVGSFEFFMRRCEAWSLDAECAVTTWWHDDRDADTGGIPVAPASNYDALPTYVWARKFTTERYATLLDRSQNKLSEIFLVPMVLRKIGMAKDIPQDRLAWKNKVERHLARKIRYQIYGRDLQSVMGKDITTPLLIPHDVEQRIRSLLHAEEDLPAPVKAEELLKPVVYPSHGNAHGDSSINLQIQDTSTGEGNFRWWVVNNSNMWAGQNHTLDEITEVLWLLFGLFKALGERHWEYFDIYDPYDCADPRAAYFMARVLRRRTLVLPDGLSPEMMTPSGIGEYEATLFRAWVFAKPKNHGESDTDCNFLPEGVTPRGFAGQDKIEYPIPDDSFWGEGLEGDWGNGTIPQWEDYTEEEIARFQSLEPLRLDRVEQQWKVNFTWNHDHWPSSDSEDTESSDGGSAERETGQP
ncbi:hypothetical protein MMC18_009347 [Xylographa bjoerkii]|nr:hypothetical protein [Xylographa bjoerkii]